MKKINQEFLLFIQYNNIDGAIEFSVTGAEFSHIDDDCYVYRGHHDFSKKTKAVVELLSNKGHRSYILIKKIIVNNIELQNMDIWSVFVDSETHATATTNFGYMSKSGKYILNFRQSPIIQNYISHFLKKCQK